METDVAVLGGGAAGLAAAREATRLGARALIVNRGPLGGDCTFTGCIPSKTLIEAAGAGHDFAAAMTRVRAAVGRIAATETAERLRAEGIEVIDGEGRLVVTGDRPGIEVDGRTIVAGRGVIVAPGSRPARPPIPGLDGVEALTTDDLWSLSRAPGSLAVLGGGPIGAELSLAFAVLGVAVTVVEAEPRILPGEEPEASAAAARALAARGVDVLTGVTVSGVRGRPDGGVVLERPGGAPIRADRLLLATGRRPATDRGGLAEAGLALDAGGNIVNDDDLSTSIDGVRVAGDAAGRLAFTHAADHMGRIAAANTLNRWGPLRVQRFRAERIPWVTYTRPEVARIGLTEAQAARAVPGAMVAELPLCEHDRAVTAGATDGFIKLIAGPRPVLRMAGGGRVVGATVVAERAGELMGELALLVRLGAFTGRLVQTVHPYPSWSYGLAKAAAQFFTSVEGRTARPARVEPAG